MTPFVVGLGASAGGLEPVADLLSAADPKAPIAWVLAQHLAPDHRSFFADILQRRTRLEVRQAKLNDVRAIADLVRRAYVDLPPYTLGEIRGQLNNYREGCFVAKLDGEIVGYCASMRLKANVALSDHTWDEVTGNGFGSRHDPTGDWLYGYEMCVDPKVRGTRLGRRLYEERRALVERLDLAGIVFGGRMPGLANAMRQCESL